VIDSVKLLSAFEKQWSALLGESLGFWMLHTHAFEYFRIMNSAGFLDSLHLFFCCHYQKNV
jgi:hypothetical protein